MADIPAPAMVGSLLIFGGAFDPPHVAHIETPDRIAGALGMDWTLFMPAADPPLKAAPLAASAEHRLAMVRLAIADRPRMSASDIEIRRGGVSYTIDTIEAIRQAMPRVKRMRLLIGADQAVKFHQWREARRIIELCEPVVALRAPMETRSALRQAMEAHWSEAEWLQWRSRVVRLPLMDASSTHVRHLLEIEGPDSPGLAGIIPHAVLDYIRAHRLYIPA